MPTLPEPAPGISCALVTKIAAEGLIQRIGISKE